MAPRDPEICNHWLSWLVTVAIPIIIISNTYMGIFLLHRAWSLEEEFNGCSKNLLYTYSYACICIGAELFRCPVCSRGIIGNSGIFASRFGEEMLLLSRIRHIDNKLYKLARSFVLDAL